MIMIPRKQFVEKMRSVLAERRASRAQLCQALQTDDLEGCLKSLKAKGSPYVRLGARQLEALSRFVDFEVDLARVLAPPDEDRILEYACVAASELMGPNTPLTDYVDTFRELYCKLWSDEQFYLLLHATKCTLEAHAWEHIDAAKAKLPGLREPDLSEAERALDLCDALDAYEAAVVVGAPNVLAHPPAENQ